MSDDARVKGIVDAVKQDDTYSQVVAELSESDRVGVEATVQGVAAILGPLIETLSGLEQSDEVMALVRARLAEKMRVGS